MLRNLLLFVLRLALWPVQRYFERHLVLRLDFGSDPPPPPDYTPVANASKEAAEIAAQLGREQLNEARWQYDQNMAVARPVVEAQLDIMRQTADQGRDYYEYSKSFRPLEQNMLRQVQGQLTPAQIVRLGVSGLRLPTSLSGGAQSAGVIAGASRPSAQQPTGQSTAQASSPQGGSAPRSADAPILRFARSTPASTGPRFPTSGVLSFLSSSDMDRMMQQQGAGSSYAGPSAPPSAPITLPPIGTRPPAPAPAPTITSQFDAFKTDILSAIDERLRREQEERQRQSNGFDGGA